MFLSVQIMLLTDPEIESSLLISSDEGATYQKYRLNFYIHSMLFHPKQEDWILAYSQDQKVRIAFIPCLILDKTKGQLIASISGKTGDSENVHAINTFQLLSKITK